jgi:hypothetical protein
MWFWCRILCLLPRLTPVPLVLRCHASSDLAGKVWLGGKRYRLCVCSGLELQSDLEVKEQSGVLSHSGCDLARTCVWKRQPIYF